MFQARPALSADLTRPLHCLLAFTQHVISYTRPTQRHSRTCSYVNPTGSSAACYKVLRHYAGDRSLRLERPSSQPRNGSLRFEYRPAGDWSLRFEYRSPLQGTGTFTLSATSPAGRHSKRRLPFLG